MIIPMSSQCSQYSKETRNLQSFDTQASFTRPFSSSVIIDHSSLFINHQSLIIHSRISTVCISMPLPCAGWIVFPFLLPS